LAIVYFVVLNSLGHLGFVGSRMTATLFALDMGASPAAVGTVVALFAALPMLLSVKAGRLIDRVGPRPPLAAALVVLVLATLLPFALPSLVTLFVSSTLLGVGFMMVHIGMNTVIGAHGKPEERPFNFAWLALSFSISGSTGPLIAGYAIEAFGHAAAFLILSVFPAAGFALLMMKLHPLPRPAQRAAPGGSHHVLDLFRVGGLRRAFIVSGLLAMGWDLYSFLMPLYGTQLKIAPGRIGVIMATFAAATFVVRLAMPLLIRRVRQWRLIAGSMALAGASYLLFPLVETPALLTLISFFLGLGLGCSQPVIMSLLYEASPPGRQSEAVGVRTTMISASQTFMPLASGALSTAFGVAPLFLLLAASLLGGAWFARRRIK